MIKELELIKNNLQNPNDSTKLAYNKLVTYFARNIIEAVKEESKKIKGEVKDMKDQVSKTFYVSFLDDEGEPSKEEVRAITKDEARKSVIKKHGKISHIKISTNKKDFEDNFKYESEILKIDRKYDEDIKAANDNHAKDLDDNLESYNNRKINYEEYTRLTTKADKAFEEAKEKAKRTRDDAKSKAKDRLEKDKAKK